MHTLAAAFLVTFAALFPIVNPIEAAPLFFVLTRELPVSARRVASARVPRRSTMPGRTARGAGTIDITSSPENRQMLSHPLPSFTERNRISPDPQYLSLYATYDPGMIGRKFGRSCTIPLPK